MIYNKWRNISGLAIALHNPAKLLQFNNTLVSDLEGDQSSTQFDTLGAIDMQRSILLDSCKIYHNLKNF